MDNVSNLNPKPNISKKSNTYLNNKNLIKEEWGFSTLRATQAQNREYEIVNITFYYT